MVQTNKYIYEKRLKLRIEFPNCVLVADFFESEFSNYEKKTQLHWQ